MTAPLHDLTDNQFSIAWNALQSPVVISMANTAAAHELERNGYGTIEPRVVTEVIFRLNQAGLDLLGSYIRVMDACGGAVCSVGGEIIA